MPASFENFVAADFMLAGQRDFGDAEAGGIGGGVAEIAEIGGDRRSVATFDHAVTNGRQQQERGRRRAGAARHF